MSKKHYTDQNKISQYIFDDYMFNRDLTSKKEVLDNINLLIDNGLAVKIEYTEYLDIFPLTYRIACKFMLKHNKSLKRFKRNNLEYEYGFELRKADVDPELFKLSEYNIDAGTYYAYLNEYKGDNYAILKIDFPDSSDPYLVKTTLYVIGYDCYKYKDRFFKDIEKFNKLKKNNKLNHIYYSDGRPAKETRFKSFDNLIFKNKEKVLHYIDNWINNIPTYYKYGISPKLSILLYGEPGTGKSTFTKALANYLEIGGVLSISPSYFSNDSKENRTLRYSTDSICSIDDVDCVCNSRETDNSKANNEVMARLLEFLDNPNTFYFKAKDGLHYPVSIVVATTNYYDKLDDAVKRYGRFDLKIEMTSFDRKEAEEMCALYDLRLKDVYKKPIEKGFKISPAYLQALCLENIDKNLKQVED